MKTVGQTGAAAGGQRTSPLNQSFDERIREMAASVQARHRYHSIELPDGSVLPGLQNIETLRRRLDLFGIPNDLRGKRVLDIGAWDGWFSFECERRGAEVVAVDCVELDTFLEAKHLLHSKVEYLTLDVNELSARRLGRFDIVLFFGVLYHLRQPLLGLEKTVELSTDLVLVESFVIPSEQRPNPAVMEFYERAELGGQVDNWCGPSPECLLAMCRSAGLAQVQLLDITSQRASVLCKRRWPEPAGKAAAPHLHSAVNNRTHTAEFHPLKDEYICCYFKASAAPEEVFIQVDGYGVPTLTLTASQANCLRPVGLEPGRHRVRIKTADSVWSNAVEFTVSGDASPVPAKTVIFDVPELCSAEFHASSDLRLTVNRAGSLTCYFKSQAETIGAADVEIDLAGLSLRPHTISSLGDSVWQANTFVNQPVAAGTPIRLRLGSGKWTATRPSS